MDSSLSDKTMNISISVFNDILFQNVNMKKILIIEDESYLREEIGEILTFEGYKVFLAIFGKEGLDLALSHETDLILCDIMMPEMDGNQLLKILRSDTEVNLTQFVFITALADKGDIRKGMKPGADDYITKPFTRDELLKTVFKRLEKATTIEDRIEQNMDHLRKSIISYIPHELRTPLNGILGLATLLIENSDNIDGKEIKEIWNTIYESGNTLYSTINKYLTYIQLNTKASSLFFSEELIETQKIIQIIGNETAIKYNRLVDFEMNDEDITLLHP